MINDLRRDVVHLLVDSETVCVSVCSPVQNCQHTQMLVRTRALQNNPIAGQEIISLDRIKVIIAREDLCNRLQLFYLGFVRASLIMM